MINITYAITVADERVEIEKLVNFLLTHKKKEDNIIILSDLNKRTDEVTKYLYDLMQNNYITLFEDHFEGNFADWKNKFFGYKHLKKYAFFIDADEYPSQTLIKNIHQIIELNPQVNIFNVPRINTVENIGLSHINKWNWGISKNENFIKEKEFNLNNPKDLDEYNLLKKYNLIIEEN